MDRLSVSTKKEIAKKKALLDRKKPLCFYDDNLLLSDNNKLFSLNLASFKIKYISDVPENLFYVLLGKNRYLHRLLRSGIKYAVHAQGKIYLSMKNKLYSLNLINNTFKVECIFNAGNGPLSMTVIGDSFGYFNDGIYFGDYSINRNMDEVGVYYKSFDVPGWIKLYSFPKGAIHHIHNIIPDPSRKKMWILTGDFGEATGMWVADMDFNNVNPVGIGKQIYRACVAFPTQQGLIYATDSHLEKNFICLLRETTGGWESRKLHEINGSCIYGCSVGKYFAFSTSTEPGMEKKSLLLSLFDTNPGPGIIKNESNLLLLDEFLNLTTIDSKEKDLLPYRLFQFGTMMFPSGKNNTNYLFSYSVANNGSDLSTEVWELT